MHRPEQPIVKSVWHVSTSRKVGQLQVALSSLARLAHFCASGKHCNLDWSPQVSHKDPPLPPRNGRSICTCLSEEPKEGGVQVCAGAALTKLRWLGGALPCWEAVQQWLQDDPQD